MISGGGFCQENAIKALQDGDVAEAHTLLHETESFWRSPCWTR